MNTNLSILRALITTGPGSLRCLECLGVQLDIWSVISRSLGNGERWRSVGWKRMRERERERERERRTEKRAVEIECFHESNLSTEGKRVLAVVFKSCGEEQVRKRSYIEVRNKSLTVLDGLLTDIVRLVTLRLLPVDRAFSNWIVNSSRFKELCSTLTWFERYWISIWSTFHFRPMQCIGATTCRESGVWLTNNSDNIVRKFARFWKCIDSSHSGYSDDVYYAVFIAWWFIEF